MEKGTITKLNQSFEEYAYEQDGVEYWLARDLQILLDYTQWRNFLNAVDRAKESCKTIGEAVSDHFADVSKMIKIRLQLFLFIRPHLLGVRQNSHFLFNYATF